MYRTYVLLLADWYALLEYHVTGVYLVLEQESRCSGLFVAVHDRPIDRRRAAVLG